VGLEGGEVVEGIRPTPLAGVDEAHEEVARVGATFGLEEERILPVQDGLLERPFADIVVQRRSAPAEG
jgi:hypothetical protein